MLVVGVHSTKPHAEAVINENFACYLQEMGMCAEASPPYTPQRKSCAEHSVGRIQSVMSSLKHEFATTLRTLQEHNKILMEKVDALINKGPFQTHHKSHFLKFSPQSKIPKNTFLSICFSNNLSNYSIILLCGIFS